eukprot:11749927-Heterocapsa_arctica.AAC.1
MQPVRDLGVEAEVVWFRAGSGLHELGHEVVPGKEVPEFSACPFMVWLRPNPPPLPLPLKPGTSW